MPEPIDELDEIFSLEFVASGEQIIEYQGLMFRWNEEWLAEAKAQLQQLVEAKVLEGRIDIFKGLPKDFAMKKLTPTQGEKE